MRVPAREYLDTACYVSEDSIDTYSDIAGAVRQWLAPSNESTSYDSPAGCCSLQRAA